MHKITVNVKAGPEMSPHTFNRDGSWQSEGMVIDGAFSTSCIQQTKNKCLPGTMLLPNMSLSSVWGQLWNTDSCYSQDRWDGVKSPSSYELWIEETQIVYGYPRYMNGHLRWRVLEFACVVFTTTHSNYASNFTCIFAHGLVFFRVWKSAPACFIISVTGI